MNETREMERYIRTGVRRNAWLACCTHKGAPEMEDFALGEVAQVCIGCSPNIASFLSIICKHGAPIDFKRDRIIPPPAPPA